VSQDRGGGSGQNIPHLFGPGTPVLVPGFQWSGWSKFMVKFGYLMIKVGLHKGFPLMYCTRGGGVLLLQDLLQSCSRGGGGEWRTCAMRDDEPRPMWISLPRSPHLWYFGRF